MTLSHAQASPVLSQPLPLNGHAPSVEAAIQQGSPFFVVETPHDHMVAALGLPVYSIPVLNDTPVFPKWLCSGAPVVLTAQGDEAAQERAGTACAALYAIGAPVKLVTLPGASLADWIAAGGGASELVRLEELTARYTPPKREKRSLADVLLSLALESCTLLCDTGGDAFATATMPGGARRTFALFSKEARRFLRALYFSKHGRAPSEDALKQAIAQLDAHAEAEGDRREPAIRVGWADEARRSIALDLGTPEYEVVRLAREGWHFEDAAPIPMLRPSGMKPLPRPIPCLTDEDARQALVRLRPYVRAATEADMALCFAWLVFSFSPSGPYPHLSLVGPQDAGKSTTMNVLHRLVDPHRVEARRPFHSERDLAVAVRGGRVLAMDNLSGVQHWLSDALCVVLTGGTFATRRLHTDDEQVMMPVLAPVLSTSIEDVASRPDLASRTITLHLQGLPKAARRPLRQLWEGFEADAPVILGGLLHAVCYALARFEAALATGLDHRMGEFAAWGEAITPLLPVVMPSGRRFIDLLCEAQAEQYAQAAETNSVVRAVRWLLEQGNGTWEGTATDLLDAIGAFYEGRPPQDVPKLSHHLTGRLNRLAPLLTEAGIQVQDARTRERRVLLLSFLSPK